MNEVIIQPEKNEVATNAAFSSIANFKELYDIGKMFASSGLIPAVYQGKPMDCVIAVDIANRMGVSPMMVMQNLYVVKGMPSWSGQACMSLIRGADFKKVRPVYTGEKGKDSWGCYISAIDKTTGEEVKGAEVTIEMAKKEGWYGKTGSKWQTMPELMLAYRAAAFFARIHIPNALMGLRVEGEAEDIQPEKAEDPFVTVNEDDPIMKEAEEVFK